MRHSVSGMGNRLWTPPITFVATANAAVSLGATVDFVDIDPLTPTMSPERLEEKLRAAARVGALPKIVAPVHMWGQPAAMREIDAIAARNDRR